MINLDLAKHFENKIDNALSRSRVHVRL